MTMVEAARGVTGGVDTHLDIHVAAALDPLGGPLARHPQQRRGLTAKRDLSVRLGCWLHGHVTQYLISPLIASSPPFIGLDGVGVRPPGLFA